MTPVDDIRAWLDANGFGRFTGLFEDNEIDGEALLQLTDEHLKELGMPLGPRVKLLGAIARLRQEGYPEPNRGGEPAPSPPSVAAPPAAATAAAAERRQLTVLFCDLVGSTALAARLDPEDLRAVIGAYHRCVAEVVGRWDGHVAKYLGDGVLAYFGWPRAHEDDGERAVRAGLAVVEAVAGLGVPGGEALAARVGIATGLVVVGDLIGEGAAREEAVVGETPNLAARLQNIAAPNGVVIGAGTRRLAGNLFELEDLGARRLKGFTEPVRAWRVLGPGQVEGRFEARHAGGLTPLVGREEELALLLRRWELAREGEGQVVLLAGEPGIGKSRLVQALRERVAGEPHTRLRYQCSPYHTASALHPIAGQLERAAGLQREDTAEVKLAKLEALLAEGTADVAGVVPLVADLVSVPTGDRYPPLDLTPRQRKERLFEALLTQLEGLAGKRPVLALYEDAHWLDPTTAEVLSLAIERVRELPVLILITFRPEFSRPWANQAHVTLLTLSRLGRRQVAALVERVTGGKTLPQEVMEQIVARTDGVPLFVEELTKAVLESGLLRDAGDRYELNGPLPPLAIPATLQDSLMARLDRSAPVKEVAQIGACIGRAFAHAMLAAVVALREDELRGALGQLAGSDLILRRGTPPTATYSFRHALVQETAYQSLLKSRRQELHARIATVIEERYPEVGELRPEWLAHHCTEGGLVGPAAENWLRAAQRAKDAYANSEATAHLQRCLDVIEARRPNGDLPLELQERKLRALVLLGDLASIAGDLQGANRYYEQALAIASDPETRARIENKRHRPRAVIRDGARIAFYEHGSGPDTLVFIAPLAYGLAAFQPIVERLCQEFRIVTVDARGTGASDPLTRPYPLSEHVDDVRAVIDALGGGAVVGVGISRGANLLFKLAHAEPWRFAKLVTIGGPPGPPGPPFFADDILRKQRELFAKGDVEGIVRFHTALVLSEPETRELRELFIQNRLRLPHETTLSFFDLDPTVDVTSILADITVATLVIHGREDRLVAFAAAEYLAARLRNATLYGFEGKGHLPLFTATDEFCQVLRSFVRTGATALDNTHEAVPVAHT